MEDALTCGFAVIFRMWDVLDFKHVWIFTLVWDLSKIFLIVFAVPDQRHSSHISAEQLLSDIGCSRLPVYKLVLGGIMS